EAGRSPRAERAREGGRPFEHGPLLPGPIRVVARKAAGADEQAGTEAERVCGEGREAFGACRRHPRDELPVTAGVRLNLEVDRGPGYPLPVVFQVERIAVDVEQGAVHILDLAPAEVHFPEVIGGPLG